MFAQVPGGVPDTAARVCFVRCGGGRGSPEFLPPWHQNLRPVDGFKPVDVPLVGAPGVNSSFKPSAHGAPFSGPRRPIPSPLAVPLPGEAELRALSKPEIVAGCLPAAFDIIWPRRDTPCTAARACAELLRASRNPVPQSRWKPRPGSSYYFLDESRRPSPARFRQHRNPATTSMPCAATFPSSTSASTAIR